MTTPENTTTTECDGLFRCPYCQDCVQERQDGIYCDCSQWWNKGGRYVQVPGSHGWGYTKEA